MYKNNGSVIIFLLMGISLLMIFCMNNLFKSSLIEQALQSRISYEKSSQLCRGLARFGIQLITHGKISDLCLTVDPWPPIDIPSSVRYVGVLEINKIACPTKLAEPEGPDKRSWNIQAMLYQNNAKKAYTQLIVTCTCST